MTYSHAALLAARCERGCGKWPSVLSDVDGKLICAACAAVESGKVKETR